MTVLISEPDTGIYSAWNKALPREGLKRMFLHAHRIRFAHPIDDREVMVEAPLPPELAAYVARLDGNANG